MMTLIIGGSGSGKSEFAEKYLVEQSERKQKYYIATMQVCDDEGQKKVLRHQKLRAGKGFLTIEQPKDINESVSKMESNDKAALLECMSNLVANEMFTGIKPESEEQVVHKIVADVEELKQNLRNLVIVSNNVFEDGSVYDDTTMAYIRTMGRINTHIAQRADEVIEVVVGIPVIVKKYDG